MASKQSNIKKRSKSNVFSLKWMRYHENDHILIFASSVAAAAGMHPYQQQQELKEEFWRELGHNSTYVKPEELAEQELEKLTLPERQKIEAVIDASYSCATDVIEAFAKITTNDATDATDQQLSLHPAIIEKVRSAMYTKHGQEQETIIRDAFSKEISKPVTTDNKCVKGSLPIVTTTGAGASTSNNIEVYVGGKHDGMVDNKIVEIKTRQRRFLGTPVYELVQVHTYMYIYGTRQAVIVESYNGQERKHEIEFDDGFWDKIKSKIAEFVTELVDV